MLPELTARIEQGVQLTSEQLATLQGVREHPYVLDDLTLARVTSVFTQTRTDLDPYAEQGRRHLARALAEDRRRLRRAVPARSRGPAGRTGTGLLRRHDGRTGCPGPRADSDQLRRSPNSEELGFLDHGRSS